MLGLLFLRLAPAVGTGLIWLVTALTCGGAPAADSEPWPSPRVASRPWTYWWWMASAVDATNLTKELERYRAAGLGGVHIIPIYGAKGFETNFIEYLSPRWMAMLRHTVEEGKRLGLGVDMTTGSGWCFGGPKVTEAEANATVVQRQFEVKAGQSLDPRALSQSLQALMAFGPDGTSLDLIPNGSSDLALAKSWRAPAGAWTVYAISQKPSGQKVKRSAPGGQGHMLNLLYPEALRHYLQWFDGAFQGYSGPLPRAMYHDSYEYRSDWAPDLFASFARRRGYRLQDELPALFASPKAAAPDADRAARVKCDYRETISDVMAEETLPMWTAWAHRRGMVTRNEAHGSPGNWLDLYAAADIPETEMFYKDRNRLISKFASSAAHTMGRNLVSSESGTWVREHFTETLADVKYLFDDLFLSGVNHIFYHGTCYSPDEATWPGWLFYASLEMNPRNSIWHDAPALNEYVARCQSVLRSGHPDNDVLLYWPIHDLWMEQEGLAKNLTIHARDWFESRPLGKAAELLWTRGFAFDYFSDRQLGLARAGKDSVRLNGNIYKAIVVPSSRFMPVETLAELLELARAGAIVVFQAAVPGDVPGWGGLKARRARFRSLVDGLKFESDSSGVNVARVGRGRVLVGELEPALALTASAREPLFDQPGLMCIRRTAEDATWYFIANRSETLAVEGWFQLGRPAKSIVMLDPMTGRAGEAAVRNGERGSTLVRLDLQPGQSMILRCYKTKQAQGPSWRYWEPVDRAVVLERSDWELKFVSGGPSLPAPVSATPLGSWTRLADPRAASFAGTAVYRLEFDAPKSEAPFWRIDLGTVCQSARARLNGVDLGTLITPPYRVVGQLKQGKNVLELEVTNVSANRIRDLDRRGVAWRTFYDINFVNLDYKPFDASNWPLTDSGLLGPVSLTPLASERISPGRPHSR